MSSTNTAIYTEQRSGPRQGHRPSPWWPLIALLTLQPLLLGCVEKTVYPAVLINIREVSPYRQAPTGSAGAYTVADVAITIQSESGVPAKLVAYSIAYQTNLGDPLPQLQVMTKPIELFLSPNSATTFTVTVFTTAVLELYTTSPSRLGPITAIVTMSIQDANGNTIQREAHCLLDPPES